MLQLPFLPIECVHTINIVSLYFFFIYNIEQTAAATAAKVFKSMANSLCVADI
jgi:hypothetical protein